MRDFIRRTKHALNGISTVVASERSFRIELTIAVLVLIAAFYFGLEKKEWMILLLTIAIVLTLEVVNSAIERLVDMLAPKTHHFAKEVKDILAGVVFLASFFAVIIGIILFL